MPTSNKVAFEAAFAPLVDENSAEEDYTEHFNGFALAKSDETGLR